MFTPYDNVRESFPWRSERLPLWDVLKFTPHRNLSIKVFRVNGPGEPHLVATATPGVARCFQPSSMSAIRTSAYFLD
jgi:hypothetical protein